LEVRRTRRHRGTEGTESREEREEREEREGEEHRGTETQMARGKYGLGRGKNTEAQGHRGH
jgi:hypothetical protein